MTITYTESGVDIEKESNTIEILAEKLTYKRHGLGTPLVNINYYDGFVDLRMDMTLEKVLSNTNYNIKKIVEELREKIKDIPDINEVIDKKQIICQHSGEDFCTIKIKKDYLEIDFIVDNTIEDPMEFSWKIKPTRKCDFNRRMQIKNIGDIDIVYGLIFQSYNAKKE